MSACYDLGSFECWSKKEYFFRTDSWIRKQAFSMSRKNYLAAIGGHLGSMNEGCKFAHNTRMKRQFGFF